MLMLMTIFMVYFGLPALGRFGEEKVMVITSRRKTEGIEAPAITIAARNPTTELSWRNSSYADKDILDAICNFTTSHDMETCIVENTYEQNEMINDVILGYSDKKSLMNSTLASIWTEDVHASWNGRVYTINFHRKIGINDLTGQIFIVLKKKLSLRIYVHDPFFFVSNTNPGSLPNNYMKIDPKTSLNHYYRLALTEVQELDMAEDPCDTQPDYDYKVCANGGFKTDFWIATGQN